MRSRKFFSQKRDKKMDVIWAPWRMGYILQVRNTSCFLCQSLKNKEDTENYVVYRKKHAFVILNTFPYNNGHLMVVPARHVGELEELRKEEVAEIFSLVKLSLSVLRTVIKPHGFNLGVNLGRVAGAGLVDHLHIHVVPRWEGDTNFMPVVAETKVIPQSLLELRDRLKEVFQRKRI